MDIQRIKKDYNGYTKDKEGLERIYKGLRRIRMDI